MAKITKNLEMVVKGLQKRTMNGKELAAACNDTTNRVVATIHSKNNLQYFKVDKVVIDEKFVKVYSLNEKGLELLDNLENKKEEDENE